jgi:dUTP pyrophosphatase
MTAETAATTAENITSPPTSPPAKRVKTTSIAETNDITMAESNGATTTVPAPQADQASGLLIKKLSPNARLPTRGSAFAAGYDIYASKDTTVPARGKVLVDTDLSMAVPAGTCTTCPSPFSPAGPAGGTSP